MKFHHIGIHVENIEKMSKFYIENFDMKILLIKNIEHISKYNGNLIYFLQKDDFVIELISLPSKKGFDRNMHIAVSLAEIDNFVYKLVTNNISHNIYYKKNSEIDYIKLCDPEQNTIEVYQLHLPRSECEKKG